MNILNKLTKNYLKLNKKRTIVTIIGILLSGAMITAVTTLAVSFQSFMLQVEIQQDGAWEATFNNVPTKEIGKIKENKNFKEVMIMEPVGMAQNPYSDDPFLYIKAYDSEALENMVIRLMEGRLPENENEIVLSETFFDGKENEPKIGDTITLTIGKRMLDGEEIIKEKQTEEEEFVKTGEKTFTVCGKIKRPDFENYSTNYTAGVTKLDNLKSIEAEKVSVAVIDKNAKNIYQDTETTLENFSEKGEATVKYNSYVLAYKGVNSDSGFNTMLYSVCGILIGVIIIGSILVIYNSFAISVSERKKQFGMLSSVGATQKQLKKSVLYEGAILGTIGIPLGILAGIGGIGVTLKIVNGLLQPILNMEQGYHWELELVISWPAIVIAAILIAFTIYLSVMIPAKRASKITPIEAIRQNEDVKTKSKKLRTPKWIRKIFGIEGDIALKNLKRSKKRYRTTVISLIISIVLFISVSGFVGYMYSGFNSIYQTVEYDYQVSLYPNDKLDKTNQFKEKINTIDEVDKISIIDLLYYTVTIPEDKLDTNLKKSMQNNKELKEIFNIEEGSITMTAKVIALNEEEYNRYLKTVGIKEIKENQAILINTIDLIQSAKYEGNITGYKANEKVVLEDSSEKNVEIEIAKITDKCPFGIQNSEYPQLILVTNAETMQKFEEEETMMYTKAYITAKNDTILKEQLKELSKNNSEIQVQYVKEIMEQEQNLKVIIQIFSYGFIVLISAIGIANIFNTISTNINLRRREFAMLKSIGMTDKSFRKMLNLECFFYGTKALLFGLPIGIIICYFINQGFGSFVQFAFSLPWNSIIISILAVYLVVFITMLYSSSKVKKENIIDVLRNENI